MKLEQYQQSDHLVTWLRALLESDNWKVTAETLSQIGPEHTAVNANVTPTYASVQLGMSRGYALFPDMLRVLLRPPTGDDDVDSGYVEEK